MSAILAPAGPSGGQPDLINIAGISENTEILEDMEMSKSEDMLMNADILEKTEIVEDIDMKIVPNSQDVQEDDAIDGNTSRCSRKIRQKRIITDDILEDVDDDAIRHKPTYRRSRKIRQARIITDDVLEDLDDDVIGEKPTRRRSRKIRQKRIITDDVLENLDDDFIEDKPAHRRSEKKRKFSKNFKKKCKNIIRSKILKSRKKKKDKPTPKYKLKAEEMKNPPDLSLLLPNPEDTLLPMKIMSYSDVILDGDVIDSNTSPPCAVKIRLKTDKESDVLTWKDAFCALTSTDYIVKAASRSYGSRLSMSNLYICQLSSKRKKATSSRAMGCKASLHLKIRKPPQGIMEKERRGGYYAEIDIHWHHTHSIINPQALARLRVPSHLKEKAFSLFSQGFSPTVVKQIMSAGIDDDVAVDGDRTHFHDNHLCPSYDKLRWLFRCWKKEQQSAGDTGAVEPSAMASQKLTSSATEGMDPSAIESTSTQINQGDTKSRGLSRESQLAKANLIWLVERMQADLRSATHDSDPIIVAAAKLFKNKAIRKMSTADFINALCSAFPPAPTAPSNIPPPVAKIKSAEANPRHRHRKNKVPPANETSQTQPRPLSTNDREELTNRMSQPQPLALSTSDRDDIMRRISHPQPLILSNNDREDAMRRISQPLALSNNVHEDTMRRISQPLALSNNDREDVMRRINQPQPFSLSTNGHDEIMRRFNQSQHHQHSNNDRDDVIRIINQSQPHTLSHNDHNDLMKMIGQPPDIYRLMVADQQLQMDRNQYHRNDWCSVGQNFSTGAGHCRF